MESNKKSGTGGTPITIKNELSERLPLIPKNIYSILIRLFFRLTVFTFHYDFFF